MICRQCNKYGKCGKPYSAISNYAEMCKGFEVKKMTNFEKIKQMSVEEIATLMNDITFCCRYDECEKCLLSSVRGDDYGCSNTSIERWLESEVEE